MKNKSQPEWRCKNCGHLMSFQEYPICPKCGEEQ